MSKDSIAVINGHEYKYRWNSESKEMDYLGPVGDAPPLTQEEFKEHFDTIRRGLSVNSVVKHARGIMPGWKITQTNSFVEFEPTHPEFLEVPSLVAFFPLRKGKTGEVVHTGKITVRKGEVGSERDWAQLEKAMVQASNVIRAIRVEQGLENVDDNWF
jgi:hypothetical protein